MVSREIDAENVDFRESRITRNATRRWYDFSDISSFTFLSFDDVAKL